METKYQPAEIEAKWQTHWENEQISAPHMEKDTESYCVMLPPPNVTGSLHMGHAFQQTLMDTLIRYNRMQGKNTLWQGGIDHAGIATQMVVERRLQKAGTSRRDMTREAFLDEVWSWKAESGNQISKQMRRLGVSIDWDSERFTMDEGLSKATNDAFVKLYKDGLIYRGNRLVNWDPVLKTALSDLEVETKAVKGQLWHIRYPLKDNPDKSITVATTRPETMLGDTGVAVHPEDSRYSDLIGKTISLPLCDREIPIVADEAVDPEFGSGCVKITPAHDFTDYEIGQRHKLPLINILTADAQINDDAPEKYRGLTREQARKQVVADLEQEGFLESIEKHEHQVPHGDRTGAVLEPRLTKQWYLKMETLAKPAIEAVKTGKLKFVPENWQKTYLLWLEDIQDWCLSRQLWWGHRIPVWYDEQGNTYAGTSEETVREENGLSSDVTLTQDLDVLDTWFSSSLWPFATLGWPDATERLKTFFPTQALITGFDIIFFWVARMVMMGLYFTGEVPFHDVYIHGLIRDSQGQKMSKTKGNVIDPIDLIDGISLDDLLAKRLATLINPNMEKRITQATKKQFPNGIPTTGTDAVRFTFASLASTGRDINFDLGRMEGNRNFCNKIWNATRFILMHTEDYQAKPLKDLELSLADKWILGELSNTITSAHGALAQYRFDWFAQACYEFIWNSFCDWYLEMAKVQMQDGASGSTRDVLLTVLAAIMRLIHPVMPFISEEIWQTIGPMVENMQQHPLLMKAPYPNADEFVLDEAAHREMSTLQETITSIRRLRSEIGISPAKSTQLFLLAKDNTSKHLIESEQAVFQALCKAEAVEWIDQTTDLEASATTESQLAEIHIPLAGLIDKDLELSRLEKQLNKLRKEQERTAAKLSNPKYTAHAPKDVVAKEEDKLAQLNQSISRLSAHYATISSLT